MGLATMSDKPLIGIITQDGKRKRKKKYAQKCQEEIDHIIASVTYYVHETEVNSVDFITFGKRANVSKEPMEVVCKSLIEQKESPINAKVNVVDFDDPGMYKTLSYIGQNVIFVIAFENTDLKEIARMNELLEGRNINLIGSIGIE